MNWIISRLKEPSTWRGIVWLLTFAGIALEPEQKEAIITAGIALAGLLGVFTRDLPVNDSQTPKVELPPIELQARLDRRLADSDSGLDTDRRMVSVASNRDDKDIERMQSPVSSTGEPNSRRSKPNFFTEGFNDR